MCQTTSSTVSRLPGYPPNIQAILAGEAATQPHSRVSHTPTAPHFCSVSRTSPARWQHSVQRGPTLTPVPETLTTAPGTAAQAADAPPKMTFHPPPAGTITVTKPGCKSALSPAPTTNREINAADINGGTRLHCTDRFSKQQFLVDIVSDLCT